MVAVLEDGSQIMCNILVKQGALSQAWNGSSAIPDFTVSANRPVLYLSVVNNGTYEPYANITGTWYYNNTAVASTTTASIVTGFTAGTTEVSGTTVRSLTISKNLASGDNTDVDTIRFEGTIQREDNSVPIIASVMFNIVRVAENTMFGTVSPGFAELRSQTDSVTLTAKLFGTDGQPYTGTPYFDWYRDGVLISGMGKTTTSQLTLTGSNVEDYTTIEVRFYTKEGTNYIHQWTAMASVDDTDDSTSVAISSKQGVVDGGVISGSYGEGSDSKLRKNESVAFRFYAVDKNDPSTPITVSKGFSYCYIRIYNSQNAVYTGADINPTVISNSGGWRRILDTEGNGEYYVFTISYDDIKDHLGGSMTGVIMMSEDAITWTT